MTDRIACYVMSGGVGSRLWPLSREDNPKQFHDFSGEGSMLARTVRRMAARQSGKAPVHVIAAERHAGRVQADIAGVDLSGGVAIYEPVGRNTAAAVALASLHSLEAYGDGLVLVAPSDHEIGPDSEFWKTIAAGEAAANAGHIVVFGVKPTQPETGYGYIEMLAAVRAGEAADVKRFVEKPDRETAQSYVDAGTFYWNTGIFLFKASTMRAAFEAHQPEIWKRVADALHGAARDVAGIWLPIELYETIPADSIDYAIMERTRGIAMTPATFRWNDLGSWQSLLEVSSTDESGNVLIGDVVAIDCERSYLRSQGRLLSVIGMKDAAVVSTSDATFVAPVGQSQNVRKVVEQLERSGRLETRFTPSADRTPYRGAWRSRVRAWLFDEALPRWSTIGVDREHGGFHEALSLDGRPLHKPKRMRTMARQVYAFSVAKAQGWAGPAEALIAHGVDFMKRGRTSAGGWVRSFDAVGSVLDPTEDSYDTAFVLLALAHAHRSGHPEARKLGEETFAFLDAHLEDARMTGFLETPDGAEMRRTNPHMHLLEAFLAWHAVTGDKAYLRRAARIVDHFRNHFFDAESWTLGEYFGSDWRPAEGKNGQLTEPGHHFEWAWLLVDFARVSGQGDLVRFARKLYASAIAGGLNRATGLAYGAVSREGLPLDTISRSWPQTEVIKAAIALNEAGGPDLTPEIEARVGRLFRWHVDPAPKGLWVDRIDQSGRAIAGEVPASILYHLICALTEYLRTTEQAEA
jgi:mannose-1-phosphate guanylyltransferase/mannose-6-phosphate isomerase